MYNAAASHTLFKDLGSDCAQHLYLLSIKKMYMSGEKKGKVFGHV